MLNIFLCLLFSMSTYASLIITPVNDACDPAMQAAISGNGITIISCTSNCGALASGTFTDDTGVFGSDFQSGIILTSGKASNAQGPNTEGGVSTSLGRGGDSDLSSITSQSVFDTCSISLEVRFSGSSVTWEYVFGSDEYPEFAGGSFEDVFGFFFEGPNYPRANVALIPGTSSRVSINTVNVNQNSQYFVVNTIVSGSAPHQETQYDGFTTGLFVKLDNLDTQGTYNLKLAIADGSDGVFDSGVFITAVSIAVSLDIDGPAEITIQCGEPIPEKPSTTTAEFCSDPDINFSETTEDGECGNEIIITRTWIATDSCGNSAHATQTIYVIDTVPPVISTVSEVTVECDSIPDTSSVTATDSCDGTPTEVMTTESKTDGSCTNSYTLTRTYSSTDSCGNTATVSQIIHVQDTNPPTINGVPPDVTVQCASNVPSPAQVTASDCGSSVIEVTMTENVTPGSCSDKKTITRTWTATDSCGNTATKSQIITVNDNTPPTITKLHDICIYTPKPNNYYCENPSTIWSASDNCQGPVTKTFKSCTACAQTGHGDAQDSISIADQCKIIDDKICFQGKKNRCYTATETYTDQCGNTADATISVSVVDKKKNAGSCVSTNYSPAGRGEDFSRK